MRILGPIGPAGKAGVTRLQPDREASVLPRFLRFGGGFAQYSAEFSGGGRRTVFARPREPVCYGREPKSPVLFHDSRHAPYDSHLKGLAAFHASGFSPFPEQLFNFSSESIGIIRRLIGVLRRFGKKEFNVPISSCPGRSFVPIRVRDFTSLMDPGFLYQGQSEFCGVCRPIRSQLAAI